MPASSPCCEHSMFQTAYHTQLRWRLNSWHSCFSHLPASASVSSQPWWTISFGFGSQCPWMIWLYSPAWGDPLSSQHSHSTALFIHRPVSRWLRFVSLAWWQQSWQRCSRRHRCSMNSWFQSGVRTCEQCLFTIFECLTPSSYSLLRMLWSLTTFTGRSKWRYCSLI